MSLPWILVYIITGVYAFVGSIIMSILLWQAEKQTRQKKIRQEFEQPEEPFTVFDIAEGEFE